MERGREEDAGHAVDGEWSSGSRRSTTRSDAGARIANPPIHSTSPIGSTALVMLSSASVATATAMRINGAPGHECAPLPNARCPAASRRASSRPGSGNCAGSWLAAESIRMTRSPRATLRGADRRLSKRAPEYRAGGAGVAQELFDRPGHQFGLRSQAVGLIRTPEQLEPRAGEKARQRLRERNVGLHVGGRTRTRKATRQLRDRWLRPRLRFRIGRTGSRQEHVSSEPVESFRVRERNAGRSDRQRDRPGTGERPHQVHRHARGQTLDQVAGRHCDFGAPGDQPSRRKGVRGRVAHRDVRRIPVGARARDRQSRVAQGGGDVRVAGEDPGAERGIESRLAGLLGLTHGRAPG